jgi:hypothetical protein
MYPDFVKMSTNITPIISCNVDEKGEYSPYKALDSGKASKMLVVNQREGQPPAVDANGNEEFFIGNVNYGRGMLTWGHYPDLGRPEVQTWWGDQYKVSTVNHHYVGLMLCCNKNVFINYVKGRSTAIFFCFPCPCGGK